MTLSALAYVLKTNPVHLLLTATELGASARLMQSLDRRQRGRQAAEPCNEPRPIDGERDFGF